MNEIIIIMAMHVIIIIVPLKICSKDDSYLVSLVCQEGTENPATMENLDSLEETDAFNTNQSN